MTAAHCAEAYPDVKKVSVLAGDHDVSTKSETYWDAKYDVERYIKHPHYDSERQLNDIALVKTHLPIRFS